MVSTDRALNVSSFAPVDATAEALRLARAEYQGVIFDSAATPDPERLVRADRAKFIQILTHLLTNAAKASGPSGMVRIDQAVTELGSYRIRVIDSGAGVDPETVQLLFTPFARGNNPYHHGAVGYGIGLVVSKRLAELHGATLTLRANTPARGSTAEFILPPERVLKHASTVVAG
ncbi:MAG: ATP-binding protein [Alphaproteobacteria bacterium]|nr:ATP-binding protein [Alphaproteobacteria bacterium]